MARGLAPHVRSGFSAQCCAGSVKALLMMREVGEVKALHFKKVCRRAKVRSRLGDRVMAASTLQPSRTNWHRRSL